VGTHGTVPLNDVWAMLKECAPGYTKRARTHNWVVMYQGHTYPRMPVGEHGTRTNPEIQIGHVRNMCNLFGILECAKKHIELLR
jgi:hypothetical protein